MCTYFLYDTVQSELRSSKSSDPKYCFLLLRNPRSKATYPCIRIHTHTHTHDLRSRKAKFVHVRSKCEPVVSANAFLGRRTPDPFYTVIDCIVPVRAKYVLSLLRRQHANNAKNPSGHPSVLRYYRCISVRRNRVFRNENARIIIVTTAGGTVAAAAAA